MLCYLQSCKEPTTIETVNPSASKSSVDSKANLQLSEMHRRKKFKFPRWSRIDTTSTVFTRAMPCGYKIVKIWEFDKFVTAPGKRIGVWPSNQRINNNQRLRDLKTKWGFNYIFANIDLYKDGTTPILYPNYKFTTLRKINSIAGYSYSNIMLYFPFFASDINEHRILDTTRLDSIPYCKYYYIDEPAKHLMNYTNLLFIRSNFHNSGKFITGDFIKTFVTLCFYENSDYVTFTGYEGYWGNDDQRVIWDKMKKRWGNKFSMVWIAAHLDLSEYSDLLGHAKNLGITPWLYEMGLTSPDSDNDINIYKFCQSAATNGFLIRYDREYTYTFRCWDHENCENCNPENYLYWEEISKAPTGRYTTYTNGELVHHQ